MALDEELARDPRVFITGEDVGVRGGVFRATQGLYDKYGAARIVDSPLAELSIVAIGIGAALAELRPICEIQFSDFIHPAFNQIVNEAAKFYYRSNGQWRVPLVIRAPYGGGISGGLYHSQSVEAFFAHVPGLKIVVPSTPHDAKGCSKARCATRIRCCFSSRRRVTARSKATCPPTTTPCRLAPRASPVKAAISPSSPTA